MSKKLVPLEAPKTPLRVFGCGQGDRGQLGLHTGQNQDDVQHPGVYHEPVLNSNLDVKTVGVVQVAVGAAHCAALTEAGEVLTWGVNDYGTLARDARQPYEVPFKVQNPTPQQTPSKKDSGSESEEAEVKNPQGEGEKVVQVVATDHATFVLTEEGSVYGWGTFVTGEGLFGFLKELINDLSKPHHRELVTRKPTLMPELTKVKQIAAGSNHILALTQSGQIYAWGSGNQGQLGRRFVHRHRYQALIPQRVSVPRRSIAGVFAGCQHSFALDTAGRVYAWGLNNFGQTGIPPDDGEDAICVERPTLVKSLSGAKVRQLAGGLNHSIACTETGDVLVWGRCDGSQLGLDLSTVPQKHLKLDTKGQPRIVSVPTIIPGLKADAVFAGPDHSFAITPEGKLFAWGFSDDFQTGLATDDFVRLPTEVRASSATKFLFAGSRGEFSVFAGVDG